MRCRSRSGPIEPPFVPDPNPVGLCVSSPIRASRSGPNRSHGKIFTKESQSKPAFQSFAIRGRINQNTFKFGLNLVMCELRRIENMLEIDSD